MSATTVLRARQLDADYSALVVEPAFAVIRKRLLQGHPTNVIDYICEHRSQILSEIQAAASAVRTVAHASGGNSATSSGESDMFGASDVLEDASTSMAAAPAGPQPTNSGGGGAAAAAAARPPIETGQCKRQNLERSERKHMWIRVEEPALFNLLEPSDEWDAFQAKIFSKSVRHQLFNVNAGELAYGLWHQLPEIQPFINDFRSRYMKMVAPGGRLEDLWRTIYEYMRNNNHSAQLHFKITVMDAACTVTGNIFKDGIVIAATMQFAKGEEVFIRVPVAGKNTFTLQIQALEFQLQFPNLTGVPIIARNENDGLATPLFSHNDRFAWPLNDHLDDTTTCLAQMVGLLQFGVGPRHPQKKGAIKWANWGFPNGSEGKFATTLYSHDVPPAPHFVWVTGTGFRFADQGDGAA